MITLFVTVFNFEKVILANRVRVDFNTNEELKEAIDNLKKHIAETFNTHPEFLKTIIEV